MFKIGDKVTHPLHGAGVISSIDEILIDGSPKQYFALSIVNGSMVVMVPVDGAEIIGLRHIVSAEIAERIFHSISSLDGTMTSNWSRRYRDNLTLLKSGDIVQVAQVVKGLRDREKEKALSTGERKMYRLSRQIFISEISLSLGMPFDKVENELDEMLK